MIALVGIHTILTVLKGSASPTPVQENTKNILYEDAAMLLIHDHGGSGTFFYVASALNIHGKF